MSERPHQFEAAEVQRGYAAISVGWPNGAEILRWGREIVVKDALDTASADQLEVTAFFSTGVMPKGEATRTAAKALDRLCQSVVGLWPDGGTIRILFSVLLPERVPEDFDLSGTVSDTAGRRLAATSGRAYFSSAARPAPGEARQTVTTAWDVELPAGTRGELLTVLLVDGIRA
jgi:hypothetical protein